MLETSGIIFAGLLYKTASPAKSRVPLYRATCSRMSHIYKVHHIPTSNSNLLPFLAGKFASLRLSALSVSRTSFSSTFELESKFTASEWIDRLQRRGVETFVAVAYSPDTMPEHQTVDTGDWVGSVTLLGPTPKSIYDLPNSGGPSIGDDDVEDKWQICRLYNSPEHRRKGIAKMLINGAMEYSAKEAGVGRQSRVRLGIHPDNVLIKMLYDGLGFVDAGNCTLHDAFIINGDSDLLPEDGGASQPGVYHNPLGLLMMKTTAWEFDGAR
ncbi:hypothetical protein LSUE1_G002896 [Lachnellula suecica]|uniref:N-acetyltransferase domain-containing protein n=1 Tax=Lachnellula suecica TaxID=602035 RepID=A0A8T9C8R0_9HELO|nr:hypothetical protein LSUE1_G002896 [Lachnellula suecica]